jgi:hypothetical protein
MERKEDEMDTRKATMGSGGPPSGGSPVTDRRPLQRILLFGALICFALPFLTVTCYGADTTVSGIEAATSIDLDPSDSYGERELERDESANVFAFLALVSTAGALVFAFRMQDPRAVALTAAVGVFGLEAFYLYALNRAVGEAYPRIGFLGALFLLVGATWTTVERVPRWIPVAIGALAISMLPGAVIPAGDVGDSPILYLAIVFGGLLAVAVVVGPLHRPAEGRTAVAVPSTARLAVAGIVGVALLALGIVAGFLVASGLSSVGSTGPGENTHLFATVMLAANVAAGFGAWAAGRAIARPRRREPAVATVAAV